MRNQNKLGVLLLAFVAAAAVACGGGDGGSGGTPSSSSSSATSGSSSSSSGGQGGSGQGGSGQGGSGQGGQGGSEPTGASFADVQSQVLTSCQGGNCHGAAPFRGGLDLTPANAYAQLVNVQSRNADGGLRVTPGDPDASFLYRKITNDLTRAEGDSMPDGRPLLAQDKLDLVKAWIEAGALR